MKRYIIKVDGKSYDVEVTRDKDEYLVNLDGREYRVGVEEPLSLKKEIAPDTTSSKTFQKPEIINGTPGKIVAPITGTILRILYKVGDNVLLGKPIAVIEAMKMEIEIVSNKDGKIKEIYVNEKDTVEAGQLLFIIE